MKKNVIKHPFGFWEIKDKPTPEDLHKYYSDKYYQEAKGSYEFEYTSEELGYFQVKLEQRLAVIKRFRGEATGSLLDIGCGEGYNLAFFREHGWSVRGIDYSSAGVISKNPECLEYLFTGDCYHLLLEEISLGNTYDILWLQNILEHVIDPIELLRILKKLISPEGILVVTVPNDFSITQIFAQKYNHIDSDFWVVPPDHLNYFSAESLQNIAGATGWKCMEMLADFPIDWFLFHPGSNYVRDKKQGKAAHMARIQLETIIHRQPIEDVVCFFSALAGIGFGRDITAFFKPQ